MLKFLIWKAKVMFSTYIVWASYWIYEYYNTLKPYSRNSFGSSTPQVVERLSWYHLEGQSHKWRSTEKNRTNTSWEGDPRKKCAMAWSFRQNGWSTHSEASAVLGSFGIQEKIWQVKDELERCGREGPPKNGIDNAGRGWSISSRQTFVASTCGPMHRRCWMSQGQGVPYPMCRKSGSNTMSTLH